MQSSFDIAVDEVVTEIEDFCELQRLTSDFDRLFDMAAECFNQSSESSKERKKRESNIAEDGPFFSFTTSTPRSTSLIQSAKLNTLMTISSEKRALINAPIFEICLLIAAAISERGSPEAFEVLNEAKKLTAIFAHDFKSLSVEQDARHAHEENWLVELKWLRFEKMLCCIAEASEGFQDREDMFAYIRNAPNEPYATLALGVLDIHGGILFDRFNSKNADAWLERFMSSNPKARQMILKAAKLLP